MKYFNSLILIFIPSLLFAINPERTRGTSQIIYQPEVTVNVEGSTGTSNISVSQSSNEGFPESNSVDIMLKPENITTTGIVMNEQGKTYKLTGGVEYTGTSDMFTITAANVTIDLDGRRIRYRGDRNIEVNAIKFAPSIKSATIKNGIIVSFTGAAIDAVSIPTNLTVNLSLKNLLVANCNKGVNLKNVANSRINNIRIYRNRPSTGDTYGIQLVDTNDVRVIGCSAIENISFDGSVHGFLLKNNRNCLIKNCYSINNIGYTSAAGFCISNTSRFNAIVKCQSYSNDSQTGNAYGFYMNNTSTVTLEDNKAANNKTESNTHNSYGFYLNNCHDSLISNNRADRNDYGFFDNENSSQFSNIFVGNQATQNLISGFFHPVGRVISHIKIDADFLQKGLSVSTFDNVNISTK